MGKQYEYKSEYIEYYLNPENFCTLVIERI